MTPRTTRHIPRLSRLRCAARRTKAKAETPLADLHEESHTLIGRDGETLEAIQFLLNRLIQAKTRTRTKYVDCEHYLFNEGTASCSGQGTAYGVRISDARSSSSR